MSTDHLPRRAAPLARIAAGLLDATIFLVPAVGLLVPVGLLVSDFSEGVTRSTLVLAFLVYTAWLLAVTALVLAFGSWKGGPKGTPGMRIAGTRVVDVTTLRPIGLLPTLLRYLVLVFTTLTVVGLILTFVDRNGRGWHDKVVGSMTIGVTRAQRLAPLAKAGPVEGSEDEEDEEDENDEEDEPTDGEAGTAEPTDAMAGTATTAGTGRAAKRGRKAPRDGADAPDLISVVPAFDRPLASAPSRAEKPISEIPSDDILDTIVHVAARPAPAVLEAAPKPEPSDDGASEASDEDDVDATRMSTPASPAPGALLVWDDGTVAVVAGTAVFGRNPVAGDLGEAQLVPVDDTTRSLSKTHFAFVVEGDQFFVIDRHSTNGTEVVSPDGSTRGAFPGIRTVVAPGDRLVMAQRNLTIGRA